MALATLTQTERGTTIRITKGTWNGPKLTVEERPDEDTTNAVNRTLTEAGWVPTGPWTPEFGGITARIWTAEVVPHAEESAD